MPHHPQQSSAGFRRITPPSATQTAMGTRVALTIGLLSATALLCACSDVAPAGSATNNDSRNTADAGNSNNDDSPDTVEPDLDTQDNNDDPPDVPEPQDVPQEDLSEPEDAIEDDVMTADVRTDADDPCVAINVSADNAVLPVDIVWIIDASPSMEEEITIIEANLNAFAARIGASALDYRVVIIGSDTEYCADGRCYLEICVPAPLSATNTCPDQDSERYLHVRTGVHSRDGLDTAMATFDQWSSFLRPEALTHFVMVTDDNVGFGADEDEFTTFMQQNAALFGNTRFHSIVDLIGYQPGCGIFDDEPPCSCGEERGESYITLSERTGGLVQSVCQEDWDPIFEALEAQVREGTELPCTFELPQPEEEGMTINPAEVNVVFFSEDRSMRTVIPQVTNEPDCALADGWYYDDPDNPTAIHLCPQVCATPADIIEIEIGCRTVKY